MCLVTSQRERDVLSHTLITARIYCLPFKICYFDTQVKYHNELSPRIFTTPGDPTLSFIALHGDSYQAWNLVSIK